MPIIHDQYDELQPSLRDKLEMFHRNTAQMQISNNHCWVLCVHSICIVRYVQTRAFSMVAIGLYGILAHHNGQKSWSVDQHHDIDKRL